MPILRLLEGLSLGPTEIEDLCNAYEDALRRLRLVDRKDPITDLVAKRILEVHQRGDCAPADISRIAVSELGRKPPSDSQASSQLRVLIVEDEYYLASDLAEAVETIGASVAGICGDLGDALKEADSAALDAAIVDINLHDCDAFPVADRLKARDIPFLFATGYGADVIPIRFSDVTLCEKPFDRFKVARQIVRLCANRARPAR
jgi:CheY-like chemotaxis protein